MDVASAPARVLVVEDEASIADALRYSLEREGFQCRIAIDGRAALSAVRDWTPHLVLLDLMLPGVTGTDVCREIRRSSDVPILVVSARDSETDKVLALEVGADDYITKPFALGELVARVRAGLRRQGRLLRASSDTVVRAGPVALDPDRHEARVGDRLLDLPPKEFALLEVLLRRAGRLCTREHLIADVWGPDYFGDTRTLDVHVKRLRAKLEPDRHRPRHLVTVRGLGYRFDP